MNKPEVFNYDDFLKAKAELDAYKASGLTPEEVKALKRHTQWISVKDKMPDDFVSVLTFQCDAYCVPPVHEGYHTPRGGWVTMYDDNIKVTQWMPLPEAEIES